VNDRATIRSNFEILALFQIFSTKLNAVFTPCYCVASTTIRNIQTLFTHPTANTIKEGSNMTEGIRSFFSNEHTRIWIHVYWISKRTSAPGQETNRDECDPFKTTPLKKKS